MDKHPDLNRLALAADVVDNRRACEEVHDILLKTLRKSLGSIVDSPLRTRLAQSRMTIPTKTLESGRESLRDLARHIAKEIAAVCRCRDTVAVSGARCSLNICGHGLDLHMAADVIYDPTEPRTRFVLDPESDYVKDTRTGAWLTTAREVFEALTTQDPRLRTYGETPSDDDHMLKHMRTQEDLA